jgi:anti-sigma factor RsiW
MTVSELELHAYIDGQLLGEERDRVAAALMASQYLAEQVSALYELKQLVRLVYAPELLPQEDRPG